MANVWQKGEKFAATALGILQREIKLPAIFTHRYGIADFSGAAGDVVNVKRPPILRARDAGFRSRNTLVVDSLSQSKIQVRLNRHPYSRVELSPEEATLDEVNYVRDVQQPQVRAIVEDFDDSIVGSLGDAEYVLEVDYTPGTGTKAADPRKVAAKARKLLNDYSVPIAGRYWLVGSAVAEEISNTKGIVEIDKSGMPESLREGVITRLRGFTVVEVASFDEDESYFVHESAVALAAVAPKKPNGAIGGASIAGPGGLGITQVWDYNSGNMGDQSTVHAFTGATPVLDPQIGDDGRVVLDDDDEPVMEFVRAVKVTFTPVEPGEPEPDDSSSSSEV